jgi:hypothetical protein
MLPRVMRVVGALLFLAGAAAAGVAIRATFERSRGASAAAALGAPVAVVIAIVGLVLAFVPRFMG